MTLTSSWWAPALIVLVGAVAYSNSLTGPFIFDDQLSVVGNHSIREWRLANLLFPERELPVSGRPLVNISFAFNYAVGGLDVSGYHVWNILTHLCSALIVFGIAKRTLESGRVLARSGCSALVPAFAAALIWTLHPLNTEAVTYVTQRTESMMGLFYLSTVYASIRAAGSPRAGIWTGAAVVSSALGMMCKESMVTAPLVVLLHDRTFVFDSFTHAFRRRWPAYAGLAATWVVLAALVLAGPRDRTAGFFSDVSPYSYLLNQAGTIAGYLRLAVWPRSLVLYYGPPLPLALPDVIVPISFMVLLLLVAGAALFRWSFWGFWAAWFFITLAPTSSVVPIATEVGAERRMYLPLIALVTLAVTAVWQRVPVLSARAAPAGALLVVLSTALAAGTLSRNREYESAVSMARTVLARRPTSVSHHILGMELIAAGRREEGLAHLREATRGDPRARYNLGVELIKNTKLDEGIEHLQAFVREAPGLPQVPSARTTMGGAFALRQQWPQAIEQFRLVLKAAPSNRDARRFLADALFAQRSFEEAGVEYRQYLTLAPDDRDAQTRLGITEAATGRIDEAISTFTRVLDADPSDGRAHRNLAEALLERGDLAGGSRHARQAVTLKPDDPAAHDLLGRAFLMQNEIEHARAQFEEALRIDPTHVEARENLKRVTQGRRVR